MASGEWPTGSPFSSALSKWLSGLMQRCSETLTSSEITALSLKSDAAPGNLGRAIMTH